MPANKDTAELFGPFITNLKARVQVQAVILFGSRARGDAGQFSDYDLLIIADFKEPYQRRREWVIRLAPLVSIDLFCFTPAEFESLFNDLEITAIDAVGEGVVLFGEPFVEPFKAKHTDLVVRGMKKTDCVLLPPQSPEALPIILFVEILLQACCNIHTTILLHQMQYVVESLLQYLYHTIASSEAILLLFNRHPNGTKGRFKRHSNGGLLNTVCYKTSYPYRLAPTNIKRVFCLWTKYQVDTFT